MKQLALSIVGLALFGCPFALGEDTTLPSATSTGQTDDSKTKTLPPPTASAQPDDPEINFEKIDKGLKAKCLTKNQVLKLLGLPATEAPWGEDMAGQPSPVSKEQPPQPSSSAPPAGDCATPPVLDTHAGPCCGCCLPGLFGCPTAAPCNCNCNPERTWVQADYLLSWIKNAPLSVPIASVGLTTDRVPGALGQPGTVVVSPHELGYDPFSGGQLSAGMWFDDCRIVGVEASGFLLQNSSAHFTTTANATSGPNLYVPYLSAVSSTGVGTQEQSVGIGGPPTGTFLGANGAITATSTTNLWGSEVNGLLNVINENCYRVTTLLGVRYLALHEDLGLAYNTFVVSDSSSVDRSDVFNTRNQFWGGNLGVRGEVNFCPWYASLSTQVGLGNMNESTVTQGVTTVNVPGVFKTTNVGGIFVQRSNLGRSTTNTFAAVPDVALELGYNLSCNVRVSLSYDFLYISAVARPGNQIDREVNLTQLGTMPFGPLAPVPITSQCGFWAQGINVGLTFRF